MASSSSDDDGSGGVSAEKGPALPNTLESTLSVFPLAEERRSKHGRDVETVAESQATTTVLSAEQQDVINSILFPSDEELLEDGMDRIRVDPNAHLKRRRAAAGNAVNVLNRRITAMIRSEVKLKVAVDRSLVRLAEKEKSASAPSRVIAKFKVPLPLPSPPPPKPAVPRAQTLSIPVRADTSYMNPNEFGVRLTTPIQLYDYQIGAIRWMIEREEGKVRNQNMREGVNGCMLAMVMGLGKTLVASTLVARTLQQQRAEMSCTLYVCPKNLVGTVRYELQKFFGDQLRVIIYHKSFLRSEFDAFDATQIRKYDVIITNYNTVTSRMQIAGKVKKAETKQKATGANRTPPRATLEFCNFNWHRIILDESHEIREHKTARFRTVNALTSSRRICMTGTPIHNRITDMFTQLEFCGVKLAPRTKKTKENLRSLGLMNMVRFVEEKDASSVTLPPKNIHRVYFDLSADERLMHKFYTNSARSVLQRGDPPSGREIAKRAFEAQACMIRVLQVCSAPYLISPASKKEFQDSETDDMATPVPAAVFPSDAGVNLWVQDRNGTAGLQSSKMREFVSLMASLRSQGSLKVVVFANLTSTLRLAIAAMEFGTQEAYENHRCVFVHGGIESMHKREALLTRFRTEPAIEALFMTLKVGSQGLNLTEADKVIYLEPWFSYSALSQGESRVHRIGQIKPVNIYYLLAKDSAEERVFRIAQNKKTLAEDVMGAAKPEKLGPAEMQFILMDVD